MPTIRELKERRAATWAQMQELDARATAENRELTAEEREAWDRGDASLVADGAEITRLERNAELDTQFRAIDDNREIVNPVTGDARGSSVDEYKAAFSAYLRSGMSRCTARQQDLLMANQSPEAARDQGVGTGAAGGFTVPQGFWDKVTETLKYYAPVIALVETIETDTGNPLPWATNDDTANVGAILGENTADSVVDLTLGQKTLGAYMYTSKIIKVSRQLLQDTGIDIEAFIAKKIGQRLGRIVNQHLTTGTGTAQPQGFITGATTGHTAPTGNTVTFPYDSLVDTMHSVDVAYRDPARARWMMHDLSIAIVRKLKDSTGQPLWQPSVQAGQPDTLLGFPVTPNNFVATMAANAKSVAFGDFEAMYVGRMVRGGEVLRLEERFADALQVAFLGFGRYDGLVQDASAAKVGVNSAT